MLANEQEVDALVTAIAGLSSRDRQFMKALEVVEHDPDFDPSISLRAIIGDGGRPTGERRAALFAFDLLRSRPRALDIRPAIEDIAARLFDDDYDYERELTACVVELHESTSEGDPAAALEPLVTDATVTPKVRYAAFYALNIYYRRMKRLSELDDLVRAHTDEFKKQPSFPHLQALSYRTKGDLRQAQRCARAAVEKLPDHPGALHHFAQVVAELGARDRSAVDDRQVREAAQHLDKAISLTHEAYPRYFATLAKLLTLQGDYDGVERAIQSAIDKEDEHKRDYPLLIGEYQGILLAAQFDQSTRRLETQGSMLSHQIESIRSESVQMLGLLAAAVAFVVTSTQIAAHAGNFDTGGRLFLLVIGGIIVIFSAFSLTHTFARGRYLVRSLAAIAIGALLIAYTIFLWSPRTPSSPAKPKQTIVPTGR